MQIFTRRKTLAVLAGSAIVPPRLAYAQSQTNYTVMGPPVADAIALLIETTRPDSDVIKFVIRDYQSRQNLLNQAAILKIADNAENARQFVEEIPKSGRQQFPEAYFDSNTFASQLRAIELITQHKMPLVPDPKSVQPIGIPSIEPAPKSTARDLLVVTTILFETLGMVTLEEGVLSVLIKENPEFARELDQILKAAINSDWKQLAKVSEGVFKIAISSKIWSTFAGKIAAKMTFRLALRCVPIVGWLYLAASFTMAIRRNYSRFSFA